MNYSTKRRRRRRNQTRQLMQLIGVLLAVLIAVVVIALVVNKDPAENSNPTEPPVPTQPIELAITSPTQTEFATVEQTFVLQGTSDPAQPVTVNGVEVVRDGEGAFAHTVQLQSGVNTITVAHKEKTVTYTVTYRYAVQNFSPAEQTSFNSGASIQIEIDVRNGSSVKVTLGDKEVEMKEAGIQLGAGLAEGFVRYTGTYKLPNDNMQDLNLGKITYTVTCNGVTEICYSADVICKKSADLLASDPSVTPDYGDYIDVGSGYVVEIITDTAETFDGHTTDDYSDPRNNYLPKGTVDYCDKDLVTNSSSSYRLMRCGRRVYVQKSNYPPPGQKTQVVDVYRGTLPDHNEIGVVSLEVVKNHTVLTLDCLWKAPFYFDFGPQEFINPGDRDFRVTDMTAEYLEITFCYATVFEGTVTIPADNPLFSSAQLTQNESDCVLRLNLKEKGGFYGWDAYYNENDQLCFTFLNPAKVTAANNAYGADLTGTLILLDVGHGGYDGGSVAKLPDGTEIDEAELNLKLAMALKSELEKTGATVVLNRVDDASISVDERVLHMKNTSADLCIALHQNSISGYPNHRGAQVQYFTPFSQSAAQNVYTAINSSGIYTKTLLDWHLYYVARLSTCPVVLTENGFMTNAEDLADMVDPVVVQKKAEAIAQGIANYFLSI